MALSLTFSKQKFSFEEQTKNVLLCHI